MSSFNAIGELTNRVIQIWNKMNFLVSNATIYFLRIIQII